MSKSSLTDLLPPVLPLPAELESWRQQLLCLLPTPITGVRTLFVGEPLKVILTFEPDGVEVLLPQLQSAMGSVARLKPVSQGRVLLEGGSFVQLLELIHKTIQLRARSYRECSCCGKRVPQESLGSLNGQPACRQCLDGRRFLF